MAFTAPKETYAGRVFEVNIGTTQTAAFGGENVLPFGSFEGIVPNRPLIAFEIQDVPPDDWPALLSEDERAAVVVEFGRLGYRYVALDLAGLRSGSMNDLLGGA